jgi:hypothetical protein
VHKIGIRALDDYNQPSADRTGRNFSKIAASDRTAVLAPVSDLRLNEHEDGVDEVPRVEEQLPRSWLKWVTSEQALRRCVSTLKNQK